MLNQFRLNDEDRKAVRRLLIEVARHQDNLEENAFLDHAVLLAQEIPLRIREVFDEFKRRKTSPILLITNNPILAQDVGPTPASHYSQGEKRPLNLPQLMHGLYASLLGEPFGFETQQNGRIFNDLISIPGALDNSSSGAGKVGLHTEDISHTQPFMPEYLGFLCLRNEQHSVSTYSSLQNISVPDSTLRILFEQSFPYKNGTWRSILFGDPTRPYLRYSPVDTEKCTNEMKAAFEFVSGALQRNQQGITLSQGDCLYLDNYVVVHGRGSFKAEYGANSRWFSRLFTVPDLGMIRSLKDPPGSRLWLKRAQ